MLVLSLKPGHDGSIAAIQDNKLLFSLESEKDSVQRYSELTPVTMLEAAELCGEVPDVIALGGWYRRGSIDRRIGAGYSGSEINRQSRKIFGKGIRYFSSTHERSHIMTALGLAPADDHPFRAVLVWEGMTGSFYLVDEDARVLKEHPVISQPGLRYSSLFGLADPSFPETGLHQRFEDSGKLMALAAFGQADDADSDITATVDQLMNPEVALPLPKELFKRSPIYNVGVQSEEFKIAAALLSKRIFTLFSQQAERNLPQGIPLHISGGCGLNCDWNEMWRRSGQFASVFVPPCTNDSGSAIGTGIDALHSETGNYRIDWDVYSGLAFDHDMVPDSSEWRRKALDMTRLVHRLRDGEVVAWVQGRWEIGPRALGNRSLLAEPFNESTRQRLNHIKKREDYRPIAPCCRLEDVPKIFDSSFDDPYMLYFRSVQSQRLRAVTHVDGTARVQTVTEESNARLHALLTEFAQLCGVGILCNTSLNFNGLGFINRMSDLVEYCEARNIDDFVVGDTWYTRRRR
ncbi:carbamoyltransferase C-terminal domain-containing protein [Streptomyces sp. NPDC102381]|uniref:carbamoyltransferase C-terminal domain-containing protein n=1 Tax=Streptomyces sp. NPDC102381 TaxID=3366164 RepID=UPI00380B3A07